MTRDACFSALDAALTAAGIVTPVLVLDRDRMEANLDHLLDALPPGMALRLVAKSLPSAPLLRALMARAGTDRLMSFNLPMLREIATEIPQAHQMLGKPLVEAAVRAWFDGPRRPARILWLADTVARLRAYGDIAAGAGQVIDVALEIDVGLHRGGFGPGDDLGAGVRAVRDHAHLRFGGLMGYDPHIPSVPALFGWRARVQARARAAYRAARAQVAETLGPAALSEIMNAAGSPTYRLYGDTDLANEVSVGSALVKPTDFDTPLLAGHRPALFIATPVVKGPMPTRLPALEWLPLPRARRQTVFIHGGHWMADPVHPPGLRYNATFGRSSNQEMLNGADIPLGPGQRVFLRPHQSEAVMLQFGPLAVVSQGAVTDIWDSFAISA